MYNYRIIDVIVFKINGLPHLKSISYRSRPAEIKNARRHQAGQGEVLLFFIQSILPNLTNGRFRPKTCRFPVKDCSMPTEGSQTNGGGFNVILIKRSTMI